MQEELLRTLIMTLSYVFIGICMLIWLYLLISALVLRVSNRGKTDEVRKKSYDRIFTTALEGDLGLIHRSTRRALLFMAVFLALVWLFGANTEQASAKRMLENCSLWVCYFIGGGISVGTLLLLLLPTGVATAQNTARLIRKDSMKSLWIVIVYFAIAWLIA